MTEATLIESLNYPEDAQDLFVEQSRRDFFYYCQPLKNLNFSFGLFIGRV